MTLYSSTSITNLRPLIYKDKSILLYTYLFYVIFIIQGYIGSFGGSVVEVSYLLIGVLPLCLTIRRIDIIVCLLLCFIPLYILNKSFLTIFLIYAFVYLFKLQPIIRIAWVNVVITSLVAIMMPFLLEIGIINDRVTILSKGVAHSFGFGNSNSLGLAGFYFQISLYVILVNKCKWVMWVLLIIINQLIYAMACSRTAWCSGLILIVTSWIIFTFGINKKYRFLIATIPFICTIIVYLIMFNWREYGVLDVYLSRRISILGTILEEFTNSNWLLGKNIEAGIPIDCAYVGIVIAGGIGWLIFFLITAWHTITNYFQNIYHYIPVIIAMMISGIGENTFISPNGATILYWCIILNMGTQSIKKEFKSNEYE